MYIYIYIYTYIYIYMCMHLYIYIHLHNSCMHAYATVQQFLCHGSYCELARTSCRLSFSPALLPLRRAGHPPAGPLLDAVCLKIPSKSTLAHNEVAAVVLHKHHLIIRVGATLIQFVYGSHSGIAAGPYPRQKYIFAAIFAGFLSSWEE